MKPSRSCIRRGATGLCLLAVASLLPVPVTAQTALSFRGGYGGFAGSDFSGLPSGPTLGGGVHLAWEEYDAEVSLEMDYSRYGAYGVVGRTTQFDYSGVIRQEVERWPGLKGGVKVGYSTRSLSVVDEPARTDGFLIGPTFSLRTATGLGASVDLSLDALYHTYEELIMYGGREYGTDQDGFRILIRVGVFVPLGVG